MNQCEEVKFGVVARHTAERSVHPELLAEAWDELEESQVMDKQAWVEKSKATLERFERYELYAYVGKSPVGAAVLVHELADFHVGECLAVICCYVLPQFRNRHTWSRFLRAAEDIARMHGCAVVSYSHRDAPWKYSITYRKVTPTGV